MPIRKAWLKIPIALFKERVSASVLGGEYCRIDFIKVENFSQE
jgi:hypothetical protein